MGKPMIEYFIMKNIFVCKHKKIDYKISYTSAQKHKQNQECFNEYYKRVWFWQLHLASLYKYKVSLCVFSSLGVNTRVLLPTRDVCQQ